MGKQTVKIASFGEASLGHFRRGIASLTVPCTFSAVVADSDFLYRYRVIHGMTQPEAERLILAQSGSLSILFLWAVIR